MECKEDTIVWPIGDGATLALIDTDQPKALVRDRRGRTMFVLDADVLGKLFDTLDPMAVRCENCRVRLDAEDHRTDDEGVPLCDACYPLAVV